MSMLSGAEQEQLLRCIETGMALADRRQLFLWAHGPLHALLPHQVLLCIGVDRAGLVTRVECLHHALLDGAARAWLVNQLGPALALAWCAGQPAPALLAPGEGGGVLAACTPLLRASGFDNVLVHGCIPPAGSGSVFALLGMPSDPRARDGYLLQLLLPYLHLACLRLPAAEVFASGAPAPPARSLSARERAILERIRDGRTNEEVALQLGISALTVKNHLQRVYRVLGVGNRAHAVARCLTLRLL